MATNYHQVMGHCLSKRWPGSLGHRMHALYITYPFTNLNGTTVEIWETINNFIPRIIMDLITYPCWDIWAHNDWRSHRHENLLTSSQYTNDSEFLDAPNQQMFVHLWGPCVKSEYYVMIFFVILKKTYLNRPNLPFPTLSNNTLTAIDRITWPDLVELLPPRTHALWRLRMEFLHACDSTCSNDVMCNAPLSGFPSSN